MVAVFNGATGNGKALEIATCLLHFEHRLAIIFLGELGKLVTHKGFRFVPFEKGS